MTCVCCEIRNVKLIHIVMSEWVVYAATRAMDKRHLNKNRFDAEVLGTLHPTNNPLTWGYTTCTTYSAVMMEG